MKCPKCGHRESKEKGEGLERFAGVDVELEGDDEEAVEGDDDFDAKAKDDVLAELEGLMGESMGKRLEKKKPRKKDDEDEDEEV